MAIASARCALAVCLACGSSVAIAQTGRYRADPEATPYIGVPYQSGVSNTLRDVTALNSSGTLCMWQIKASFTVGMMVNYIQGAYAWNELGLVLLSSTMTNAENAYDINDNGVTVGSASNGTTIQAAFLAPSSGPTFIPTFGAYSRAEAVNNRGDVVGRYEYSAGPTVYHGFLRTAIGGTVDIGSLGGGYAVPADINDAGRIVGASRDEIGIRAFRLDEGGAMVDINTDFSTYPACYLTEAVKISPSGLIAAMDICGGAWVLDPAEADSAVALAAGSAGARVMSVNDSRIAVGLQKSGSYPSVVTTACKWEADGTPVNLYDHTVNRPAAIFSRAVDINGAGQIAVLSIAAGYNRIFRLTPLCNADFNADGYVDGIDIDTFQNLFERGSTSTDMNGDGFVDGIDYDLWFGWLESGAGCPR